jgi:tripartite-type tricarboxylate transporter receptor subunit TctC
LRAPEVRAQLENMGYEIGGGSPAAFAAYLRVEYDKYAKVVKVSGAKVD